MSKGISNLLALLIVIVIIIGVAVASSGIISQFLMMQRPKGSELVLTGFVWWWEQVGIDEYVIHIKGDAVNVGAEPVNITGVNVIINNIEYNLRYYEVNNLKPNHVAEIIASGKAPLPSSNILTIVVDWCSIRECSKSVVNAELSSIAYVINKDVYDVVTVTVPSTPMTVTETVTQTVTSPVPIATTTVTITETQATTTTVTSTQTVTQTTTVTTTVTKGTWPVSWWACYDISDNIYVRGTLLKPVDEKESIPYVVKFLECGLLGCRELAVKPFEWTSNSSFEAKYYLPNPSPLRTYKIEIWSVNWEAGKFIDKVYEQTIDTSIRCA